MARKFSEEPRNHLEIPGARWLTWSVVQN